MNFSKKKKKDSSSLPFPYPWRVHIRIQWMHYGRGICFNFRRILGRSSRERSKSLYIYISLRLLINSTHFWYGISATLSLIPDDTYRVNYLSARYQVIRRRKLDHAWECGAGGRKDWPETLFSACDSPIFFPSSFWYPPSSSSSSYPGNGGVS